MKKLAIGAAAAAVALTGIVGGAQPALASACNPTISQHDRDTVIGVCQASYPRLEWRMIVRCPADGVGNRTSAWRHSREAIVMHCRQVIVVGHEVRWN